MKFDLQQRRTQRKKILQKIKFCSLLIQRSFCLPLLPHQNHTPPLPHAVTVEQLINDKARYCFELLFCPLAVQFACYLMEEWVEVVYICQYSAWAHISSNKSDAPFVALDFQIVYSFQPMIQFQWDINSVKARILVCLVHRCVYSQHSVGCLKLTRYAVNIY